MRSLWLACALALAACSAGPNTQRLPIGQHCTSDGDCGTAPYSCALAGYLGGYCQKACTTDGDCPMDSVCIGASECRRKCTDVSQCRAPEGYVCVGEGGTSMVCESPDRPDGGA